MVYMVNYDLKQPGRNYDGLFKAIESISKDCFHALKSGWFITSDLSSDKIYNYLESYIDENDNLIVCEINYNYYGRTNTELWPWLERAFKQ